MTGRELETVVGDQIVEDRCNRVAVGVMVVGLLDLEEVVTLGEAVLVEGVAGVLPPIMVRRGQFRKHTLFRSKRITRSWWTNLKS